MKQFGFALAVLSVAAICSAQQPDDFKPAETNVWGAEYPRVDGTGRVQIRIKAPDATKARVNFWSGPKVDFHKALTDAGIDHVYSESPGADHEWQTWRRNLHDFAPRLFR